MTRLLGDILREPDELMHSLDYTLGHGLSALQCAAQQVRAASRVYITGIGSSWHAGMAVQSLFDSAGFAAHLHDASELLHFVSFAPGSALLILSRSGRSIEVVRLLEKARAAGVTVVGVTNTPASPLGQQAASTLLLNMAFDHLVSISMYSGLGMVGGLLAAEVTGTLSDDLGASLAKALLAARAQTSAWQYQVEHSTWLADAPTYFLARGGSLATCHETRLLWEEAAKAPASAMMTGCFRHGPQEITMPELRLGLWLDGARMRENDLALAADLRTHGAHVMLIGQRLPGDVADLALDLPDIPPAWQFLVDILPAQLAVESLSRRRGVDCDQFRICPYVITTEGGLR